MTARPPARSMLRACLREYSSLIFVTVFAAALTVAAVGSALFVAAPDPGERDVADLPEPERLPARKQIFLDFLRPVVRAENERVLEQRQQLERVLGRLEAGKDIGDGDREWLARMARRYRVSAEEPLVRARGLMPRIDVIPESLALAQAALESAWGESRFAREANNLFGEWCFEPGCGVVPKRRPPAGPTRSRHSTASAAPCAAISTT